MSRCLGKSYVFALLLVIGAALCQAAGELPYSWYVNADGRDGTLEIATGSGGRVTGTLLGQPVEGWLVGRHLVLTRQGTAGHESWEAWIATAQTGQDAAPIIAGSFIRPGSDGPLPWFGAAQEIDELTRKSLAARPPLHSTIPTPPSVVPSSAAPALQPPSVAPRLPSGQASLAGTWSTPDGPLQIRQEGSRLTFVLPDREVPGRLTGLDSLIAGFAPGCCKGSLEQGFSVITWDNGAKWFRQ